MSTRPLSYGAVPGIVTCIGGTHDSGRGELRDRDVVRVAVSTIGAECYDYVGPNTSDVPDNCRNGSRGIELVDSSIGVARDENFTNTKDGSGGAKFRFTHAADLVESCGRTTYRAVAPGTR